MRNALLPNTRRRADVPSFHLALGLRGILSLETQRKNLGVLAIESLLGLRTRGLCYLVTDFHPPTVVVKLIRVLDHDISDLLACRS